jgi:tetratricopeptide (TPR) repeat protein
MTQLSSLASCLLSLTIILGAVPALAKTDYLAVCRAQDATDRLRVEACGFAGHDNALQPADRAMALARRGEALSAQAKKRRGLFELREMARADFEEARRLAPDDLDIQRLYVAFNSHWSSDTSDQIAAINNLIAGAGEDAGLLLQRGTAALRRGEHEKALADVQRSIELDDKNSEAYRVAGLILTTLLRNEESVAAYSAAIALAPDDAQLHYERMGPALASQQFALAREDGDAVLDQKFSNAPFWEIRGAAKYMLKDYASAAGDFVHDFKLDRQSVRLLVWKFLADYRAGKVDIASASVKAREFGDQWPSAVFRYFAGEGKAADVIVQAEAAVPELRATRLSQAKFYVAEWGLMAGAPPDEVLQHFEDVTATGFQFGNVQTTALGEQVMINDHCILEMSLAVARVKELKP